MFDMLMLAEDDTGREAAQWLPAMLMSLGVIIMLILWTMSMRGRSARRNQDYTSPREQIDRIKAGHRTREIENALSAEFVTSATEIAARLENKAERLEQLIHQADARIAALRQLHTNHQSSVTSPAEEQDTHADDRPEGSGSSLSREDSSDPPQHESSSQAPQEPLRKPGATTDPLACAVHELADAGKTPVQIAQELGEQVGKVELILALRST